MRLALKVHPESSCQAVTRIEVEVARPSPGELALRYYVTGTVSDLRMSPIATPTRGDELWQHTCFEAFVRPWQSAAYYEFNFAPSMQWAAYRFSDYRRDMTVATQIGPPRLAPRSSGERFDLGVSLELGGLPDLSDCEIWHLGLSSVIEEESGRKSYWALGHPPGKADFHHPDCFTHELACTGRL